MFELERWSQPWKQKFDTIISHFFLNCFFFQFRFPLVHYPALKVWLYYWLFHELSTATHFLSKLKQLDQFPRSQFADEGRGMLPQAPQKAAGASGLGYKDASVSWCTDIGALRTKHDRRLLACFKLITHVCELWPDSMNFSGSLIRAANESWT